MSKWLLILSLWGGTAMAEDFLSEAGAGPEAEAVERDPAMMNPMPSLTKRNYPGGADEEDLRVQANLPEAPLKTDARSLQREVYKALYNQELKDDRQDAVEE